MTKASSIIDQAPPRIHIFKRGAAWFARLLPQSWRFRICGLPTFPADRQEQPRSDFRVIIKGMGSHLGAHLDAHDIAIPESSYHGAENMGQRFLQRQRFFPRVQTVSGVACSIVTIAHTNYFHWMFECLPRLRFLQEANIPYDWLYACHKFRFHREGLEKLGIPAAKIIDSGGTPYLRAEKLLLPRCVDRNEPWIIPWLRENLQSLARTHQGSPFPRRIYISRRKASSRGVANDAEFLELLASHDFKEVFLEEYGLAEQIALFQQAEAIVGPHGAGFTNLIFCEPGTLVLELMADGYPSRLYLDIARQLRLNHHVILCQAENPARIYASSIHVDIPLIRSMLREALGLVGDKQTVAITEKI